MQLIPSTPEQVTAITNLPLVLTSLAAAVLRLGVTFDHNGVFHPVQLPGLLCLLAGLQIGLADRAWPGPAKGVQCDGNGSPALRFP
jgi:hypothetical protein